MRAQHQSYRLVAMFMMIAGCATENNPGAELGRPTVEIVDDDTPVVEVEVPIADPGAQTPEVSDPASEAIETSALGPTALYATQTATLNIASPTWTEVPGTAIVFQTAAANQVVEAIATGAVRVLPLSWCGLRFVLDGVPAPVADPLSGDLVLLPNIAGDGFQTAALLRRFQVAAAGQHRLVVQAIANGGSCVISAGGGTGIRARAQVLTPAQSLYATQTATIIASPQWVDVPGVSLTFSTLVANQVVRALGTGAVNTQSAWCGLRFTVDGVPSPVSDSLSGDLALSPSIVDGYVTAAVSRALSVASAGTHQLRLQVRAQAGTCTLFAGGGTGMRMVAKLSTAAAALESRQTATHTVTTPGWINLTGTQTTFTTTTAGRTVDALATGAVRVWPGSWCGLRFVLDGAPSPLADPASGDFVVLPSNAMEDYQTAAVMRRFTVPAAGVHTLMLQASAQGGMCELFAAGGTGMRATAVVN